MYKISNERAQNSLYLTAFMSRNGMNFFTKHLGITRQYLSALCNNHRKMTTVMRLAIEALCMRYLPEYFSGYLCNPKFSDDAIKSANEYIKEHRKYKETRREKMYAVLKILNGESAEADNR